MITPLDFCLNTEQEGWQETVFSGFASLKESSTPYFPPFLKNTKGGRGDLSWAVFVGGELVASLERSEAVFPLDTDTGSGALAL